jgi:hypothetical protein
MPITRDDAHWRLLAGVPVTGRRLELAAVPTVVLEGGDGPPLVLPHSSFEFAALWLRIVPELTRSHRVVAPDLPGHGASGLPPGPRDAAGWCSRTPSAWPRSTRPRRSRRPCIASARSQPRPPATDCSVSASSTWMAWPGGWASAGRRWAPTPWTGPGPRP